VGSGAQGLAEDSVLLISNHQYHHWVHISKKLAWNLPFLTLGATAQSLTITHVTVIDTVTGKTQPNSTVVINGNRIASVARSTRQTPTAGQIVDGTGEYLIPGLWDMHTRGYFDSTVGDGTDLALPLFLADGITGVRDRNSELDSVLQAREQIAAHLIFGPRMVVSGEMRSLRSSPSALCRKCNHLFV
jgi:imidazolonepropionase-like amidohydrolase